MSDHRLAYRRLSDYRPSRGLLSGSGRHRRPGLGLRLVARAGLVPFLRRPVLALAVVLALFLGD
jgi:hypothetical protein